MTNNLRVLKKELKSFAKKVKDFKYTDSALITFLLTGTVELGVTLNAHAAQDEIETQKKVINTSISDMHQQFKRVKSENDKLMKDYNLELIQLMEQGDHVVKSPWSSWQYGINGIYNDWQGKYKGRGDKTPDVKYERDKTLSKYKYNRNPAESYGYGNTTELGLKQEPNAVIPVSASLTPLTPKIKNANLSLDVDLSSLPNFQPRTIEAPEAPNVQGPTANININLLLNSVSKGSWPNVSAMNEGNFGQGNGTSSYVGYNGVFEGITVTDGIIDATRITRANDKYSDWKYTVTNFRIKNTSDAPVASTVTGLSNLAAGGTSPLITTHTGSEKRKNALFQVSSGGKKSFIMNNAIVNYTSQDSSHYTEEVVHQDIHGGQSSSNVRNSINATGYSGFINDFNDIVNTNANENGTAISEIYNVLGNNKDFNITGPSASFSNSYSHLTNGITVNGIIMNRGNINLNSMDAKHAVFVVSPDVYDPKSQQFFYNGSTGKVKTTSPETAMFYFNNSNPTPDNIDNRKTNRRMTVINRGTMEMNGESSVGIYQASDNGSTVHVNFSDSLSQGSQDIAPNFITSPTVSYQTAHSGKKINKINMTNLQNGDDVETHTKNQAIVLNGNKSAGIYIPGTTTFVNGVFSTELRGNGVDAHGNKAGSAGIYTNSSMDLQAHYIYLNGTPNNGQNNVGVYTPNNSIINLGYGRIRIDDGKRNTGIFLNNTAGVTGVIHSESDMLLNGGERNTAIYASGHNNRGIVQDVTVRSIKTTTATKDNVFIYAKNGSKVKTHKDLGGLDVKSGISANPLAYNSSNPDTTGQTTGAVYATDSGTEVDISRDLTNNYRNVTTGLNVDVTGAEIQKVDSTSPTGYTGTGKYTGFGLYADNNAKIIANNNKIKVENGSTAIAADNNATVDLKGSTIHYKGTGYALYTANGGKIDMSDLGSQHSTLELAGSSVGYVNDRSNPSVTLTGATIDIQDDNVIVADLRDSSTGVVTLNIDDISPTVGTGNSLMEQVLGAGVTTTSTTGATKYKYASVDGGVLNINKSLDEASTVTDSDSEVFTKRLLYQNSKINVANTGGVKANLNSTQLSDLSLNSPIGIAISASGKSTSNNDTQINNDGKIEANRVGTGAGAAGLYINYGKIHNQSNGSVEVELTGGNNNAVGLFGTNGSEITNDGTVKVGGKKSFGILGLAYRLDTSGNIIDPSKESFATSGTPSEFGKVTINNNKDITMSDDSSIGIYALNNTAGTSSVRGNSDIRATNTSTGTITINGSNNAIGMAGSKATLTNDGKININGTKSAGMYGTNTSVLTNSITGEINIAATSAGNESIGMFTDDANTPIITAGKINVGQSSYGIYGKNVTMNSGEINVADDGVGVYATGSNVNLNSGKITVANNNAVGVYIADDATNPVSTTVNSKVDMSIGNTDSFGYLITASKNATNLTTEAPNDVHVGEKSVYIYSNANQGFGGNIINKSNLVMDQNNAYGIYSSQDFSNQGNIDLTSGVGNIGLYSTQGVGTNTGYIKVGPSNTSTKQYGIGMATGYYNETTKATSNQGTIINEVGGVIDVSTDNSVGMYAVGAGSKAINKGTINLSGNNTTGMYIDKHAVGENYGTIQTTPTANGKGIKGVVVTNGGVIKNYGKINIQGAENIGVYAFRGDESSNESYVPYEEYGTPSSGTGNFSTKPYEEGTATDRKTVGKASVKVPPASLPSAVSISIDGVELVPSKVDTNIADPKAPEVKITDLSGITTLNLATEQMDHNHTHSNAEISSLGMYVDTSGINYTNPIQGISNLHGLTDVDLIMGTEVTKYLNAKAIQIGDNILKPYNRELSTVVTAGVSLNVNSSSLTWIAQPVQGTSTAPIKTVYMVKIPYTDFASKNDVDTEHFLDGLEQRYGVEDIHSREKQIFNKLNDLGKGEPHIFAQAVNEMKGYEYSNTQQRINATGNALDKEFKYLWKDWRNPSKQNNKIKVFGMKDEYKTNTAGVIDYDSNAWGVAYVHEDEKVQMGKSSGWYAGAVTNRFKFKDLGKSREDQTMVKLGIFKTMSPRKDYNGSLQWTVAGDIFGGINNMHRKYWVVDDTFEAKSTYSSYGAALKNELGYDIRMSERTHLRPYGALKMEYGRFNDIKENSGQMRLEVKGNDYFSVKPEAGLEFKYIQPLAVRTQLSVGLTAAYENEIGKLNKLNQARVRYTTADWYNLRSEKEDRRGNGKFDLNIGVDNTRFGVTVNAGYDTKGNNVRGGIGFRAIY